MFLAQGSGVSGDPGAPAAGQLLSVLRNLSGSQARSFQRKGNFPGGGRIISHFMFPPRFVQRQHMALDHKLTHGSISTVLQQPRI